MKKLIAICALFIVAGCIPTPAPIGRPKDPCPFERDFTKKTQKICKNATN